MNTSRVALPDGRRLRVVTAGAGGPAVVFEAGLSGAASGWLTVQRAVAARHRTVAYDRSGLGGSDPDDEPRTLARMSRDFACLLDGLGETEPAVLVGHSWGGPLIRAYAAAHPERVAGIVLVDATRSEQMDESAARGARRAYAAMALLSRVGLHAPLARHGVAAAAAGLPAADRRVMERDVCAAATWRTGLLEARGLTPSMPGLVALESAGLPDVPVVAVCGALSERWKPQLRADLIAGWRDEMKHHPRGRFVLAERSGHLVPQQQPELIAEIAMELLI